MQVNLNADEGICFATSEVFLNCQLNIQKNKKRNKVIILCKRFCMNNSRVIKYRKSRVKKNFT